MQAAVCSSLTLANENRVRSIAFALMGTGALGWQDADAAATIVAAVLSWADTAAPPLSVQSVCLFDRDPARAARFRDALDASSREPPLHRLCTAVQQQYLGSSTAVP